jgi:hypothetical protein
MFVIKGVRLCDLAWLGGGRLSTSSPPSPVKFIDKEGASCVVLSPLRYPHEMPDWPTSALHSLYDYDNAIASLEDQNAPLHWQEKARDLKKDRNAQTRVCHLAPEILSRVFVFLQVCSFEPDERNANIIPEYQ